MAKQTSDQKHEVNRAEFKRWKAQIIALQKTVKVIEAYVREIQKMIGTRRSVASRKAS